MGPALVARYSEAQSGSRAIGFAQAMLICLMRSLRRNEHVFCGAGDELHHTGGVIDLTVFHRHLW